MPAPTLQKWRSSPSTPMKASQWWNKAWTKAMNSGGSLACVQSRGKVVVGDGREGRLEAEEGHRWEGGWVEGWVGAGAVNALCVVASQLGLPGRSLHLAPEFFLVPRISSSATVAWHDLHHAALGASSERRVAAMGAAVPCACVPYASAWRH